MQIVTYFLKKDEEWMEQNAREDSVEPPYTGSGANPYSRDDIVIARNLICRRILNYCVRFRISHPEAEAPAPSIRRFSIMVGSDAIVNFKAVVQKWKDNLKTLWVWDVTGPDVYEKYYIHATDDADTYKRCSALYNDDDDRE